jgi:hypothetical protein
MHKWLSITPIVINTEQLLINKGILKEWIESAGYQVNIS